MAQRPLKIPGHRPLSRPEDRERPFSGQRRDPRLGTPARCLSRGRRPAAAALPQVRDVVAAREAALRRLRRLSDVHAEARQPFAEVRRELVDCLLRMRTSGLEVVEAILRWRASSSGRTAAAWIDPGSGENYLLKMKADTQWLADSPLGDVFRFSPKADPFFVVPSACEKDVAPTNNMTPTLQARRPSKTALPLQSAMLRRIRKAELVILEESVHARLQQATSGPKETSYVPPFTMQSDRKENEVTTSSEVSVAASMATGAPPLSTAASLPKEALVSEYSAVVAPIPVAQLAKESEGDFKLVPANVTDASMRDAFQEYSVRVDPRMLSCFEGWQALESLAKESAGPETLEWFWLYRRDSTHDGKHASTADGLAVFQLKKTSTCFGFLAHLSIAGMPIDADAYAGALQSVKNRMFACLPIRSIRTTLWYTEVQADGERKAVPEIEKTFKQAFFRWFQLKNTTDGRRGQVLNRPRGTPDDGDPEAPEELPSLQFCFGQVWLRGGAGSTETAATRRVAACAWNLVLASLCFRDFWVKDAQASQAAHAANPVAAKAAELARAGLIRGLLTGELQNLLQKISPVGLVSDQAAGGKGGSANPTAALANHVARSLEASGGSVPCAQCKLASDDAVGMVQRLSSGAGYAEACAGLGLEAIPDVITGAQPQDVAFGRLFVSLDWLSMNPVGEDAFEVPAHAVGRCSSHPHPVVYLATTEDEMFAILIPWGSPAAVPREEAVFAACTEILRNTEPLETAPFPAVRISGFSARTSTRTSDISNVDALGFPTSVQLQVCEFSSLFVSGGRPMPGRLVQDGNGDRALLVTKPFVIGLWHTDIDSLNVPLCATLVV